MPVTPKRARVALGFDYGQVRIGVAVGQELTGGVQPLITLTRHSQQIDWQAIAGLIAEWRPDVLVVGLPRHADDSASKLTPIVLDFCQQLKQRFSLPLATVDERLSSHEAKAWLAASTASQGQGKDQNIARRRDKSRKSQLDRVAAALILQTWLRQQNAN